MSTKTEPGSVRPYRSCSLSHCTEPAQANGRCGEHQDVVGPAGAVTALLPQTPPQPRTAPLKDLCRERVPGPLSDEYAAEGGIACLRRHGHAPPCISTLGEARAADAAADAPPAIAHPCPRCGQERGAESRILCPTCWAEAPAAARRRWTTALTLHQQQHPAALALLAWARQSDPPRPRPWPERTRVRCAGCKAHVRKPSRRALAEQLQEILAEGTPKKVRERAELVARRLRGLCEACAAPGPRARLLAEVAEGLQAYIDWLKGQIEAALAAAPTRTEGTP